MIPVGGYANSEHVARVTAARRATFQRRVGQHELRQPRRLRRGPGRDLAYSRYGAGDRSQRAPTENQSFAGWQLPREGRTSGLVSVRHKQRPQRPDASLLGRPVPRVRERGLKPPRPSFP